MPKTEAFDLNKERYEAWFDIHKPQYINELNAVRELVPLGGEGLEIGVGTGRFAVPLEIRYGIDPSATMLETAREKGIITTLGVAEHLPYDSSRFDFTLMVTTICFVDDPLHALLEAKKVLKPGGTLIIGFVDKESELGKEYLLHKKDSLFYREAEFFSVTEIEDFLKDAGFVGFEYRQTIFGKSAEADVRSGFGEGSFVVVSGKKPV
ncbi:MAG: methyltransferase type 11 [Spirochaetes bacterium GWF1_51_8]|nr:MAG: methyltransferase type 11 [Spirochaetes bacterium GWF1_51_8]